MENLLNEATTISISLAVVISLVVEFLIKPKVNDEDWLPHIASGVGIAAGLIFGMYLGQDLFMYGLAGFLGGLGSIGLFETGEHSAEINRKRKE